MRPAVFRYALPLAVQIREAKVEDLEAINHIIERAVMRWPLTERVKQRSLPSLRYQQIDLMHDAMRVAVHTGGVVMGVVVWTDLSPDTEAVPASAGLLHGLYVDPAYQRRGVGTQLLYAMQAAAQRDGKTGILVKAQPDAGNFFLSRGWAPVSTQTTGQRYPHQYWCELA